MVYFMPQILGHVPRRNLMEIRLCAYHFGASVCAVYQTLMIGLHLHLLSEKPSPTFIR
ncbi:uncharacterized protein BDW43DRAFT_62612 [Aspergillus alliaceus]|uniref:uncharacterized protein n=1 Tax=Petromyces alliaceus TaxID=209559 RepID=UPI0012A52334|nr:uncharacterized protein BDW43DRAFT_62612 [Aspergillus alliaceus]KAB8234101.1 hypothetical protein BDW43DRAFT_62612 [Aspergillus alliaceus]